MKKEKGKKKALKKLKESPPQADEKSDPFDFGGLPKRDLKKNLGCG